MNEETITNVAAPDSDVLTHNGIPTTIDGGEKNAGAELDGVKAAASHTYAAMPGVNVMRGDESLHTISVLVENQPGVLARVAHVFARRGFNLESLAVSRTEDPTVSRMTIVVAGDDDAFLQMGKQVLKLIDVIKVIDHTRADLVGRELALIKLRADASTRGEILRIANEYRANLVDISNDTLMIEVTGEGEHIDAMQKLLEPFEILELVRTGLIVLVRGEKQT
jgi:acetolactate synthase-1/3 small subunit